MRIRLAEVGGLLIVSILDKKFVSEYRKYLSHKKIQLLPKTKKN